MSGETNDPRDRKHVPGTVREEKDRNGHLYKVTSLRERPGQAATSYKRREPSSARDFDRLAKAAEKRARKAARRTPS